MLTIGFARPVRKSWPIARCTAATTVAAVQVCVPLERGAGALGDGRGDLGSATAPAGPPLS
ncbi:hypothetical protein [Amycolatopsis methanolica]|uniref:hypothetical protein n=1 Tax=Amycolatopsis methanolica TaxID=1814 RepID=UPI00035D3342|nr:hypothetical protein [Amycolatopsis methanolica]